MIRSQKVLNGVCGIILAVLTSVLGLVSTWLLAGFGICGIDLTGEVVVFAVIAALVMPAATAHFLPAPWWVAGVIFCLLFPLTLPGEIADGEWSRALSGFGCIVASFSGAWLCRSRARKS